MPAKRTRAARVTTNPPCLRCGGRSQKYGFASGKQQYLCQGECGRRFFKHYSGSSHPATATAIAALTRGRMEAARVRLMKNPRCPRCSGLSRKAGFDRGIQMYCCKGDCRRFFSARYASKQRPPCPRCSGPSVKAGKYKSKQQYRCKGQCKRHFILKIREGRTVEALALGDNLLETIRRNLPKGWQSDLREDIAQEMALAALDGEFDLSELPRVVHVYRRKINRLSANKFKFVSIDQIIPNTNGLTIGETLAG